MDYHPSNYNKQNSNRLTINYKYSIKSNKCRSENNDEPDEKLNFDKETLNLFKGIVKIKSVQSNNNLKAPIIKYNSANSNSHIYDFTNNLYNNEEHLNKNQNFTFKNYENDSPKDNTMSPIKTFSSYLLPNQNFRRSKSSMMIVDFSKEKNNDTFKKSLFKYNSNNFSGLSLKRKPKINNKIKSKFLESSNNNRKSQKNYSFFFKLKEKEKIPSKTPYLDKKLWNSSYNVTKYNDNNNACNKKNVVIKKTKPIAPFVIQSQIQKDKRINMVKNDNNKEKKIIKNDLEKNKLINNKDDNAIVDNNGKNFEKKDTKKLDENRVSGNNKNLENKKVGKNNKNIIINILNKPFFCCLKS